MRNEELYPHLTDYFAIFDPEQSEIYPPAAGDDAVGAEPDASRVVPHKSPSTQNFGKVVWRAVIILLIAAIVVGIFILIGVSLIPELG